MKGLNSVLKFVFKFKDCFYINCALIILSVDFKVINETDVLSDRNCISI